MLFLGLDLAWGRKNTSGGCILSCPVEEGGRGRVLDYTETLGDDDAVVEWIGRWNEQAGPDGLLLGVDAPLLVPNLTGKRPCETELGKRFARFQAGAHPANRTIFGDDVRGERLVSRLSELGIAHDPYLAHSRLTGTRQMMEVFPHPAHVVLFGLAKTLKYKPKPKRTYEMRWAAMNEYSRLLRSLAEFDPPLDLPDDWPPADMAGIVGSRLKQLEDGMDALTCAYIVFWYWRHGQAGAEVIGDMTSGYVVIPQMLKRTLKSEVAG